MECISTVSVIINGEVTGHILPSWGLQQGDPLSSFLFLLCAKGLSALIKKNEEDGTLHGFRFYPQGISISHLFFAYDFVIFCNIDEQEIHCLKNILACYEPGSGQGINFDNSSIFFGKKSHARVRKKVGDILRVKKNDGFRKYLGLNVDFGASKQRVFEDVRKKINAKLMGWSEQFLS